MFEFKFNDIGEGLEEGKIAEILVGEGQTVKEGDSVFSVETDKVTTDLPAPVSGTITKILVKPGDTVHVGTTIAYIEQSGATTFQQAQPTFTPPSYVVAPQPTFSPQQPNFGGVQGATADFVFTDVGEGLTEGKVADIFKRVGDTVKEGDAVFSVETDKVTTDLYAPKTGTIAAILVQVGQNIHVGEVLAKISLTGAVNPMPQQPAYQPVQPTFPQFTTQPQPQVQTAPSSQPAAAEGGASVVGEVKVSNKILPLFGNQKKK